MVIFDAHFDGKHLCPEEPVVLPVNVRLRVVVEEAAKTDSPTTPALSTSSANGIRDWLAEIEAEFGLISGPSDWSAEHDHYLYGTPKRGDQTGA